jgi:hypothetical protein
VITIHEGLYNAQKASPDFCTTGAFASLDEDEIHTAISLHKALKWLQDFFEPLEEGLPLHLDHFHCY